MIVLRPVGLAGLRAEMTVLKQMPGVSLQDLAFVLEGFSIEFAGPRNRTADSPVRANVGTEHVLLGGVGIGQGVPHLRPRRIDGDRTGRDQVFRHRHRDLRWMWSLPTRHPSTEDIQN